MDSEPQEARVTGCERIAAGCTAGKGRLEHLHCCDRHPEPQAEAGLLAREGKLAQVPSWFRPPAYKGGQSPPLEIGVFLGRDG